MSVTRSSNWRIHLPPGIHPDRLDLLAGGSPPAAWRRLAEADPGRPALWAEASSSRPTRPPPTDRDELLEFAAERLAGFKRPRVLRYVEALPRNALGEVMKHELRP